MSGDNAAQAIPYINLDTETILLKADSSDEALTYESSLSGVNYAIGGDGGILILSRHQFFGAKVEEMRVIREELGYIIEEAERWRTLRRGRRSDSDTR